MDSVEEIIERMRQACGVNSDVELAKYLGLSRSNAISSWKTRGSKPYAYCEIVSEQEGVTMDWLLTGKEPKHRGKMTTALDQQEMRLLDMIEQLSEENRREILSRIESMYSANQQAKRIEELESRLMELSKKIS
ncbi:hypothetical protein GCM10023116_30890 [Kistimonas scapharcae]|uniref:Bacteriophage CI repressor N-terminal domain-containing protein n=1 Tax=Kistimonas scapharcae TaxID=1036133 RepID=A0ABP8V4S2_9GAMM